MIRATLLLVAVALAACLPPLHVSFVDVAKLPPPRPGERAAAEVLLSESRIVLQHAAFTTHEIEHRVIRVLDQRGVSAATTRFFGSGEQSLMNFRARTVSPHGDVFEVPRSALHSAETRRSDGGLSYVTYSFEFPHAAVGSTLEYTYTLAEATIPPDLRFQLTSTYPTREARIETVFSTSLGGRLRAFNTVAPVEVDLGQFRKLSLVARDLPAVNGERDAPGDDALPHAVFTLTWSGNTNLGADWSHALDEGAETIALPATRGEATPDLPFDVRTCQDAACIAQRAVEVAREKAEFSGFSEAWPRPVAKILESHRANPKEKARLIHLLLTKAGVRPDVVFVPGRAAGTFDESFPAQAALRYVLLRIPRQGSMREPLWIDPGCESCRPGELPPWSAGARGVRMHFEEAVVGRGQWESDFVVAPTNAAWQSRRGQQNELHFAANGDAHVRTVDTSTGRAAINDRLVVRDWGEREIRKSAEAATRERVPAVEEVRSATFTCDRAAARCEGSYEYDAPALGLKQGDRWLLPLTLLRPGEEKTYPPGPRELPIVMEEDFDAEDVLRITLPPGCVPEALPADADADSRPMSATILFRLRGDGTVEAIRRRHVRQGVYPPSEYEAMRSVMQLYAGLRNGFVTCRVPPAPLPAALP